MATNTPYGIKAYGTWHLFKTEKEYKDYLEDWIANTDGSERNRASLALGNLYFGINMTNTDI